MAVVRFVGQREHEDERCFGVEVRAPRNSPFTLTKEDGCDGSYNGKRYFKPKKSNTGLFVKSVVRKIRPEELLQQVAWLNDDNRALKDENQRLRVENRAGSGADEPAARSGTVIANTQPPTDETFPENSSVALPFCTPLNSLKLKSLNLSEARDALCHVLNTLTDNIDFSICSPDDFIDYLNHIKGIVFITDEPVNFTFHLHANAQHQQGVTIEYRRMSGDSINSARFWTHVQDMLQRKGPLSPHSLDAQIRREFPPLPMMDNVPAHVATDRRRDDYVIPPMGQLQRHTAEIPTTPHFQPSKVNHSAKPERNDPYATIVPAEEKVDRFHHEEEDEKAVLLADEPAAVRGTVTANTQPPTNETCPGNSSVTRPGTTHTCHPSDTSKHIMAQHQKTESTQFREIAYCFGSKSRAVNRDSLIKAGEILNAREAQSSERIL